MTQRPTPNPKPTHQFLLQVGTLLHRHGTPSHRLERLMLKMANHLGVDGTCLYTPTALLLSIIDEDGESTYLRRVDSGQVDVDKLIRFDETMEDVESGKLSLPVASQQMKEIGDAKPTFSGLTNVIACAIACGAVAVFFRGPSQKLLRRALLD